MPVKKTTAENDNSLRDSADLAVLAEIVERFTGRKIVLFGDFVADEFQFGEISRVSREAPVLILRHRETRVVPGGGANAANNFAALGAKVFPVTVVGDDSAGAALTQYFREMGVSTGGIVRAKDWTTPTKARFLAGWAHTVAQQVLRVDREPQGAPSDSLQSKVAKKLGTVLKKAEGLAVSDYGFGVASPARVRDALRGMKQQIPVALDARYQMDAYAGS
jgi:rfaE bifunctional protein kinase chain/domain